MEEDNSTKSLDIEKGWIDNQEYLQGLVKIVKSKKPEEIDSNLAYEVAYSSTYISIVQSKESSLVSSWLLDCKTVFDMVLSLIPYDKIINIPKHDYKKLLRCRYNNIEDASYESSYISDLSGVKSYLGKMLPSLVVIGLAGLLLCNGSFSKLSDYLVNLLKPTNTSLSSYNDAVVFFEYLSKFGGTVLSVLAMLMLVFSVIKISISLLYIMIPIFRAPDSPLMMFDDLVSADAKEAVRKASDGLGVKVKINDYDRITRNEIWLKSMIDAEKASSGNFFVDSKTLLDVQSRLNASSGKSYYLALAQIEFLHDKFMEYCYSE